MLTTASATSNVFRVFIAQDSTGANPGNGMTGLTISSSGLIISTICDNEATATAYTAAGSTIESITTLGTFAAPTATKCRFKQVDATNNPGLYELQIADARFAVANARRLVVSISGVSGMAQTNLRIELTQVNLQDSQRAGLVALPSSGTLAVNPTINATQAFNNTGQSTKYAATLNSADVVGSLPADFIAFTGGGGDQAVSGLHAAAIAYNNNAAFGADIVAVGGDPNNATRLQTLVIDYGNGPLLVNANDSTGAALATASNLATANTKLAFLPAVTAGAAGGLFIAGANAATTVGGVALSTLTAAGVWNTLTSTLSTVGSIGKLVSDSLPVTSSSGGNKTFNQRGRSVVMK